MGKSGLWWQDMEDREYGEKEEYEPRIITPTELREKDKTERNEYPKNEPQKKDVDMHYENMNKVMEGAMFEARKQEGTFFPFESEAE